MKTHNKTATLVLVSLVGLVGPLSLRAQDRADFAALQTTLEANDTIIVTTTAGDSVEGKMLEISPERIILKMKNGPQTINTSQIVKVQRKKNGVLLGALIGTVAMLPVANILGEYLANEGGDSSIVLIPLVSGFAIGAGIDALIPSQKTVYERSSKNRVTVAPLIDRKGGVGVKVGFNF